MAVPEVRLVLNFSFIGALVAAAVYFYGKKISDRDLDLKDDTDRYGHGVAFVILFMVIPLAMSFLLSVPLRLRFSDSVMQVLFGGSFLILGPAIIWMSRKLDYYRETDNDLIDEDWEIWKILFFSTVLSFTASLGFFSFGVWGGIFGLTCFVIFSTATADLYSQMKKDERAVFIETEKDEYYGTLFRVNENFHYLKNKAGVYVINNDKIEVLKDMSHWANQEGDVLIDSVGYHGGFNKVIRGRENFENIEDLRTDLANWMKNENFEDYKDSEIDVAIVYHYTDKDNALDVDNLVKPVISALENDDRADENEYLIEDDSQIREVLAKSMRAEIKDEDYLTISFREHSQKPMKLVKRPIL
ncbi:hypothetical protein [Candidatus Nanohalovita haloferacivicina]|uniref:hypothetical protein n=1 Tax=Candidatus Nanohalovita haloferacivicina TaxID=2978046 RepID=UPI00325FDDAB|nr:hypothetical protein HBNXNv_0477 [Candidatus Nanohalobia archaeon BNXNv]